MKVELKGYLHCQPYVGDTWILTEKRINVSRDDLKRYLTEIYNVEGTRLDRIFSRFEGKRVKITIEVEEQ